MASSQANDRPLATSQVRESPVIVYVGEETDLAAFHAASLRAAGYNLLTVFRPEEAVRRMTEGQIDVVIVGHHLTFSERQQVEQAARQCRPKPRVVLLYDSSIAQTEQADAVLNINSEPQHLAQTIRYLLTGSY